MKVCAGAGLVGVPVTSFREAVGEGCATTALETLDGRDTPHELANASRVPSDCANAWCRRKGFPRLDNLDKVRWVGCGWQERACGSFLRSAASLCPQQGGGL